MTDLVKMVKEKTTAAFTMYDKSLKTNVVVYTLTLKNSI